MSSGPARQCLSNSGSQSENFDNFQIRGEPSVPLLGGTLIVGFKMGGAENVAIAGNGPPLLLLHGNPLTHVGWHKVAPSFSQSFTVIAPDLRGYGDSSKPPGGG